MQDEQKKQREKETKVVNKSKAILDELVAKVASTNLTKNVDFMRFVLSEVIDLSFDESVKYVCRALDLPLPSGGTIEEAAKLVNKRASEGKPEEVFSLLLCVLLFYNRPHRSKPQLREEVKKLCRLLNISTSAKKKKGGSKRKPTSPTKTRASKRGKNKQ